MTESARKKRNTEKLKELYPGFSKRIERIILEMEKRGYRPRIQDAWRSPQDQLTAFNKGYSKLKYGFHNVTGKNGEKQALAVDLLDDDFPLASRKDYLLNLAGVAKENGLHTGIRWGLPAALVQALDKAIATEDWKANVKTGWDPAHIEPIDITPLQAKSGRRPS